MRHRQRWRYAKKKLGAKVRATIGSEPRVGHIRGIRNPLVRYVQYLIEWDVTLPERTPRWTWMAEDDVEPAQTDS